MPSQSLQMYNGLTEYSKPYRTDKVDLNVYKPKFVAPFYSESAIIF